MKQKPWPGGTLSTGPRRTSFRVSAIVFGSLQDGGEFGGAELPGIGGHVGLLPGILVGVDGLLDVRVEPRSDAEAVLNQDPPQSFDPDALNEVVAALEILAVFAVVLHEAAHVLEHVVLGRHGAEEVSLANAAAGRAA